MSTLINYKDSFGHREEVYHDGDVDNCCEIYLETSTYICHTETQK